MEKRPIEAYLDEYFRKLIAEELRLLYAGEEDVPEDFLELLQALKGQTLMPGSDAKNAQRKLKKVERLD